MPTVAILGASGFLGRHVTRVFADAGYPVVACQRRQTEQIDDPRTGALFATTWFDVTDADASRLWEFEPRIIVNCAAYGVAPAERNVELALTVNATSLAALVALADSHGVDRFLHVGSAAEYGAASVLIDEDMGVNPAGLYGRTKAAGSIIALAAAEILRMDLYVARPFGFYGPGEHLSKFVPSLARALIAGQPIDLTSGRAIRDYTFVGDICDALLSLAKLPSGAFSSQIFNIASGLPISIRDLGEAVVDAVGADPTLARWGALPDRPEEVPFLVGSPKRITDLTGWRAETTLKVGIAKTVKSIMIDLLKT
ncbi:NAD(P)-dependent oxidoreductase [Methylobacterium durans]|uniref:NAD-dependent epimerase/dehydratase family protein n=1 Tax=Methylobacterium durans TaxID=2202825 RepID=UPI002AFF4B54|nr:NAD(P)-dependent oxidoreductase [Methylobacterium durans]MEA1835257.1 NAD(P)-dependent oxidoreductase [Methylobacterium durans]